MKKSFLLLLAVFCAADALAAKRDFRGLFGSYRREKFTENEVHQSDFGIDLMLSTLIPVSPVVKSIESVGGSANGLLYSTFFNVEGAIHYSFGYNWLTYLSFGYYTYNTRKENSAPGVSDPALPLFHQFDMTAFPVLLGVKYRFSTSDIVPYVGIGAGVAFVRRKASYDYDTVRFNETNNTVLAGQAVFGFEFYFGPRSGIRLETSAFYMALPEVPYSTGGNPGTFPEFIYQPNLFTVRYASGLFFLF